MALTDLTGTKWFFNASIYVPNSFSHYINFSSYGGAYTYMGGDGSGGLSYGGGSSIGTVYNGTIGRWNNHKYRTVTVNGGADVQDQTLISWFESNAEQFPLANKVVYDNKTLIDLTKDTVTEADVLNSKTFHLASGLQSVGTASISGKMDLVSNPTANDVLVTNSSGQAIDSGVQISDLTAKQDALVSGTNIKTVNGNSILGSGNVVVGGFSPTLLWTNPSPTASFTAQTVTVDLSAYEWAMIEFKATRDADYVDVQIFEVGSAGRLQAIASGMSRRVYESSTSSIVFNAGYNLAANGTSFATSNTVCVPYKIYGL